MLLVLQTVSYVSLVDSVVRGVINILFYLEIKGLQCIYVIYFHVKYSVFFFEFELQKSVLKPCFPVGLKTSPRKGDII